MAELNSESYVLWSCATGGVPGADQTSGGALLRGFIYFYVPKFPEGYTTEYIAVLNDGTSAPLGDGAVAMKISIKGLGLVPGNEACVEVNTVDGTALSQLILVATPPQPEPEPEPEPLIPAVEMTRWHLVFRGDPVEGQLSPNFRLDGGSMINLLGQKPHLDFPTPSIVYGSDKTVKLFPTDYNRILRVSSHVFVASVDENPDPWVAYGLSRVGHTKVFAQEAYPVRYHPGYQHTQIQSNLELFVPAGEGHDAVDKGVMPIITNLSSKALELRGIDAFITISVLNSTKKQQ